MSFKDKAIKQNYGSVIVKSHYRLVLFSKQKGGLEIFLVRLRIESRDVRCGHWTVLCSFARVPTLDSVTQFR
jgi:hypothetical protein